MIDLRKKSAVTTIKTGQARVVSTYKVSMVGMTYWGSLWNIPNYPSRLSQMQEQLEVASTKTTSQKYASSRDAAHAGDQLERYFAREQRYYNLAFKGPVNFVLSAREAEILRLATGFGQRSDDPRVCGTAAHPIVHAAFGLGFHAVTTGWAQQTKRTCYLVTIISKGWQTSRARPRLDIAAMRKQVTNVLAEMGFDGLLILEIQGMRSQEKDLHPHFHGIISPGKTGALPIEQAKLRLEKAFPDFDGIIGADVKPCRGPKDIEHFMMYAAKSPDTIKRLYEHKGSDSSVKTREGVRGYSACFALDILRARSAISLPATILAHGSTFLKLKRKVISRVEDQLDEWGIIRVPLDRKLILTDWLDIHRRRTQASPRSPKKKTPIIRL